MGSVVCASSGLAVTPTAHTWGGPLDLGGRDRGGRAGTAALYSRFASQGSELFADKVQSAQRKGFGGHEEKRTP